MYTAVERKRILALERRIQHLDDRIAVSDKDLSYDKVESAALKWVLRELRMSRGEWK